ncbi:Crp/Fnr family transcriptional regulator [Sediminicola luteus]|uniref:Cyclic nucleotide-binding domain-containing protein n=1 Tax=Sediminicola luteus TaxID=319238 RepID=A0A2A4G8U6_9FLAO|nr:Crp/Fnr family transcriptional regulator [Sediminicola luteus]PCE64175.1 hypothetical protein B7P33_11660 [Sediminicola luteus]
MEYDLILKNVGRFITLDQVEKEFFLSLFEVKRFNKKEFLLRAGDIARFDYFTNKGCLKIYKIDEKGTEHISMFAIEDWWSGDMASFILQKPSHYYIQALEASEVLQISRSNYDLLFEKIPKFERFYRILYQRSLVSFIERSDQNNSLHAEERYRSFIQKYPSLIHRVSQKNMAAYLGVTPEFLSVLRKKMLAK